MSNNKTITKEEIRTIFNSKGSSFRIDRALNRLINFIRQDENLPHVVNNIINYLNEQGNNSINTIARAWMNELNKVLEGTKTWEEGSTARIRISARTLPTSGVLDLVKHYYYDKGHMEVDNEVPSVFMTRELTEQEKINARMTKMRAAKARKAEERKRLAKLEEAKKQHRKQQKELAKKIAKPINKVEQNNSGEEFDSELEYLKKLNF